MELNLAVNVRPVCEEILEGYISKCIKLLVLNESIA